MKKIVLSRQSKYIDWLWSERYQLSVTVFAALIPMIIKNLLDLSFGGTCLCCPTSNSEVENNSRIFCYNYLFQAIFIFVTLFVLIYNKRNTDDTLRKNKKLIANYIERYTYKRIRKCEEKYMAFNIVSAITRQFYIMWIVVWLLWLIYYMGMYLMCITNKSNELSCQIFGQVFDFLSTAAMFGIYIILNNVTTQFEKRSQKDHGLWNAILFLVLLFTIWISLLLIETNRPQYSTLFVSAFSATTFVLVLGKLNSNYLQIPPFFLLVMYIYAIFQAYIPFKSSDNIVSVSKVENISKAISFVFPYATFIGKIFVMLTLCWIVDKKRLIFFIIHKSAALDETPVLLDKLDCEPVEF